MESWNPYTLFVLSYKHSLTFKLMVGQNSNYQYASDSEATHYTHIAANVVF